MLDFELPETIVSEFCPYCGDAALLPHGAVFECGRCGSISDGPGAGLEEEYGVIVNGITARNLPEEIRAGMFFTGEFRGNRAKRHCEEAPLLTMAAVSIAAQKAGLQIEKVSTGILILEKE